MSKPNKSNPYNHIKYKNSDSWYLYWVFEDPDFQNKLKVLKEFDAVIEVERGNGKYSKADKLRERFIELQKQVCEEFRISEGELDYVYYNRNLEYSLDFPLEYIKREADGLVFKIPFKTLREDYLAAWGELSRQLQPGISGLANLKKPATRRRSAEEPQLVYAIFKARQNKLKFREIFALYQQGNLPMYEDRPTNNYVSVDNLKQMYRRNKPDR